MRSERGIAIYLGMLMMSAALATALFVATVFVREYKITREIENSLNAVYVADSAMEYTLFETRRVQGDFTDLSGTNLIQQTSTHYNLTESVCATNVYGTAAGIQKRCSVDVYPATTVGSVAGCPSSTTAANCTRVVTKGAFNETNRALEIVYENL